jgi:hypothetical protein
VLSLVAGLPGLIALFACLRYGTKQAFLWAYLPVLLLLPDGYRWPILGHLTFHEAAILPIGVWFLFGYGRTWKFSLTDLLLGAYCALTIVSQLHNRNFYDARNTFLRDVTYMVFPYMLAKGLFWQENFGLEVAKRITILLAIISIVSLYEFKMTVDLFESVVHPFFTMRGEGESFRYGLTRIAGPFGHALCAGIMLLVGYRIARWLEWSGYWRQRVPFLGISAIRFCEVAIVAGSAMTVARGAWTGAIIGALLVLLGRARNRVWAATVAIVVVLVLGPPIYWGVHSYVSPGHGGETSFSQQTATYRINLIADYLPIIEQRPGLGYGQGVGQKWDNDPFPVMDGMWSIDDNYLLIALTYGLYALGLWVGIMLWINVRLLWFGLNRPYDDPHGSLAWTLAGACALYMVALVTVYLGFQTAPLLYMIWGWAEGLLVSPAWMPQVALERSASPRSLRFNRAMTGVVVPALPGLAR